MSISGVGFSMQTTSLQGASEVKSFTNKANNSSSSFLDDLKQDHSKEATPFMQDVIKTLENFGFSFSSNSESTTPDSADALQALSASSGDVGQALQDFIKDLQSSLMQANNNAPPDSENNDNSFSLDLQNGHKNFVNDLKALINSVGNNDDSLSNAQLSSDFSKLIETLQTGSTGTQTPSLQDFLNIMLGSATDRLASFSNMGSISATSNVGTIISTQV